MTYADLQEALRVLGLGERATFREIKTRHRELVKRHHPDTAPTSDPDTIRTHSVLEPHPKGVRRLSEHSRTPKHESCG